MKRTLAMLLAVMMILSLAACGGTPDSGQSQSTSGETSADVSDSTEKNNSQEETSQNNTTVGQEDQQENKNESSSVEFESNTDLKIVTAFVYDRDTHVVVENIGEQPILNFRIAYINFDKNGFVTTNDSDGYEGGKHDTVNLMPGEKAISAWYGASGDYAVATVVGVDYADGSTWEASQIHKWVEESKREFSVEKQKNMLAELKEIADAANTNDYATLVDAYIEHGNQFSSDHDFHFSVSNTSEQGITRIRLFVLEFDENGFPVNVSPYDTYCTNGHSTGGTVNLGVGKTGSYSDDLFISATTTNIKVIISAIEFQDGTDWTNPYLYEWIVGNNQSY